MYDHGPYATTLLAEKLMAMRLPIEGVSEEKGRLVVQFAEKATEEQRRTGEAIAADFDPEVEVAKVKQLTQLMVDFEAAGKAGFNTGLGYSLGATTEDQTEFNKLQTSIAMFTGAGLWDKDTTINVLDTDFQPHTMTIGEWQQLSLGYVGFCLQLVNEMGLARAAVLRGKSVKEIQTIHLTNPLQMV
jgi:hypothetical protein